MRSRMFRDDLERVVDEIENSAIMWLGISKGAHGYDAIDTDEQVTVRGEVARLTRLYDRAVKTNTLNAPDMYSTGAPGDPHSAALRERSAQAAPLPTVPPPAPAAGPSAPATVPVAPQDPDASPATKPPEPPKPQDSEALMDDKSKTADDQGTPKDFDASKDKGKDKANSTTQGSNTEGTSQSQEPKQEDTMDASTGSSQPVTVSAPVSIDPDESPASAAHLQKHTEDTSNADGEKK